MKKIISALLVVFMIFALCACGQSEYKLGMGIVLNTEFSNSEKHNAQVDATVAAVVTDAAGKIVSCRLDAVQDKMDVTDGAVNPDSEFKTKMELGDDYNMVKLGNAVAEWYDQAKAFESYVVGKTGAEVGAMELKTTEDGHQVTTDEALYATCSISIADFIAAVVKACNDDQGQMFKAGKDWTLGVAAISNAGESTAATKDEDGVVKMYSAYGASVVGKDGKILAAVNDATQPKISINAAGEILEANFNGSKRELKEDYGMVSKANAIAEWYQQSKAFSDFCAGKTAAEVSALEVIVDDNGHMITTDQTLLAQCTMSIAEMMEVIAQAANYAR